MKNKFLSLALMIAIGGTLAACNEVESEIVPENKIAAEEIQEEVVEEKTIFDIGETYSKEGLNITLNSVKVTEGSKYDSPENDKFIVANITVENNTEDEVSISSLMNFELKDEEGYSHSPVFLVEGVKSPIDGSIEPGGISRGEVVYDVPVLDRYELHYSEVFKKGRGKWEFKSSQIEGMIEKKENTEAEENKEEPKDEEVNSAEENKENVKE